MKICFISDTHSYHRELKIPECDALIHCGDISWRGELNILEDFSNWMKDLPIKHKLCIFGNHELGTQNGYKRQPALEMLAKAGVIYLEDSGIDIDGIYVYGSPFQPIFHSWEYNLPRGPALAEKWSQIPDKTQVLFTHGPPMGMLDEAPRDWGQFEHVGCQDLLNKINKLPNLKIHAFGHIHPAYGVLVKNNITFVNASSCDSKYKAINKPIVVEL